MPLFPKLFICDLCKLSASHEILSAPPRFGASNGSRETQT